MVSPRPPVLYSGYVGNGVGAAREALAVQISPVVFDVSLVKSPPTVARPSASVSASASRLCRRRFCRRGIRMANQTLKTTKNHLRHVDSMSTLPSRAGKITGLNAVILGEALASEEDDLVFPNDEFVRQALVPSPKKYLEMYKRSIEDPAGFWSDVASQFYWKRRWAESVVSENFDVRNGSVKIEWFKGGITNICYNCLDRNVESGNADKIAIYWEPNEPGSQDSLTYSQLLQRVCQLANYLKDKGVRKGDAIVIYLPMLMELPIAMLACARIGAVHSVVFAGFSADSLAQRIVDCKPKVVITCNAVKRGSKVIPLKDIVDASLIESAKNGVSVDVCLTYENESAMKRESTKWQVGRDVWWQDVVPKYPTTCEVEWVDAEDPLFLLYTSGSTGKPKITPLPGAWPQKPGSATFPFFGVQPVIVDEKGAEIEGECSGYLCVKSSWPGAFRTLYGDHERYEPHTSSHSLAIISVDTVSQRIDGLHICFRDKDGYYWLTGRVDDVINVSGHRIGTAEVESALVSHPQCAEAAVVGFEHEVKGQGIYAFVTLVDGVPYSEELRKSLILTVRNQIEHLLHLTKSTGLLAFQDTEWKDNEEDSEKDCFQAVR
ncbi:hypothetical protein GH714_032791 [Hevea brasiliensis]|uniref:acetate--CoA ligase n=1 Tax=Hevea brasiliensis TaxID=3981 RepID=A0A6A6NBN0_HEVBR|nr:hypothetical protein GH714_032791 [Hevea brasiliensis]